MSGGCAGVFHADRAFGTSRDDVDFRVRVDNFPESAVGNCFAGEYLPPEVEHVGRSEGGVRIKEGSAIPCVGFENEFGVLQVGSLDADNPCAGVMLIEQTNVIPFSVHIHARTPLYIILRICSHYSLSLMRIQESLTHHSRLDVAIVAT